MNSVPKHLFQYFESAGIKRSFAAGNLVYMEGDDAPSSRSSIPKEGGSLIRRQ